MRQAGSSMYPIPRRKSEPGGGDRPAQLLSKAQSDDPQQIRIRGGRPQLAGEYYLSQETVKKIVYNKKAKGNLPFYPHAISAEQYSQAGMLEEWIHTYLLFERRNREFSEGLHRQPRQYMGPLAMSLSLFSRSSGPEEHMKWQVHPAVWEERVTAWQRRIRQRETLPPLIVNYGKEGFELNCGSPLYEALIREGIPYFPVVIWCSSEADREEFAKKHLPSMASSV